MAREPSKVGAVASLRTRARAATPPRPSHERSGKAQITCVRRCVGGGSRRQATQPPDTPPSPTLTPTSCPWTGRAGCQTTASTCAPVGAWSRRGCRSWCGSVGEACGWATNEQIGRGVVGPISVVCLLLRSPSTRTGPACRVCAARAGTHLFSQSVRGERRETQAPTLAPGGVRSTPRPNPRSPASTPLPATPQHTSHHADRPDVLCRRRSRRARPPRRRVARAADRPSPSLPHHRGRRPARRRAAGRGGDGRVEVCAPPARGPAGGRRLVWWRGRTERRAPRLCGGHAARGAA